MNPKLMPAALRTPGILAATAAVGLSAAAHEVAVTLQNPDPVTRLILPQLELVEFESARQFERKPGKNERICQPNYADDSNDILGWTCSEDPFPWYLRTNCRDWTAVSIVRGTIPIGPNTVQATFGDNGRLNAELDLRDSEFTVTLLLVGERVGSLTCSLWHPFEQTIVYAVDIHVTGPSANASIDLEVTSDGRLEMDAIDSFELEVAPDSVDIDTLTNNQIDLALAGTLATLAPLPGVVPLAAAGAYALINSLDLGNLELLQDLAASVHGAVWKGCDTTEDCLASIAEGAITKNDDTLLRHLNDSLAETLELSQAFAADFPLLGIANSVALDLDATITGLATSGAENSIATFWDVTVSGAEAGTCGSGITGFNAPPVEPAPTVRGDLALSAPLSLVAEAGAIALSQLDLCGININLGAFSGQFSAAGDLSIARSGPREIQLSLPMQFDAATPGTGHFEFETILETKPELGRAGETLLILKNATITNLSGEIQVSLNPKTKVRYTFDNTACVSTNGGPCVPVPNLGPTIQSNINNAIATRFPIPLTFRSTVYIAPHVYLQERDLAVGDASFSLGIDIKDGSTPVDLAIPRIEAAAPYSEIAVGTAKIRRVPLNIIVKNKDRWNVSPPVDVLIQVGLKTETRWLPPLSPGEEYPLPLSVSVIVDAGGKVTSAPTVIAHVDPNGGTSDRLSGNSTPTIFDPSRANNRLEQVLGTSWFRPDYTVEISNLEAMLQSVQHGTTVLSREIVGGQFNVTARVRNIGGGHAAPTSLRQLALAINGITYATQWVGPLESGTSLEVPFDINVPEGPNHYPCAYDVRASLGTGDAKPGNDSHTVSVAVSSSGCLDGGATESDLREIEQIAEDFLDARFESMGAITWNEDNRGHDDGDLDSGTSNAPILDQVNP